MAGQLLEQLKESYDVIVLCTSSFGDGDPPDNYNAFLLKLLTAAEDGSKPLAGLQHAVLGEGSSVYRETFQNCPRLTDKYLEECGSRRFVARHETDVGGEEDESVSRNAFRDAVFAAFDKGLPAADAPPAAPWSEPRASHGEPTTQIVAKSVASSAAAMAKASGRSSSRSSSRRPSRRASCRPPRAPRRPPARPSPTTSSTTRPPRGRSISVTRQSWGFFDYLPSWVWIRPPRFFWTPERTQRNSGAENPANHLI